MPDFLQVVSMLREQMNATLSRSDVLKPMSWLIGILSTATVAALFAMPPEWILVALVATLIVMTVLYALAYGFCLFADRDALRSERYSLHKMAIEHGIYGDSISGITDSPATRSLPAPSKVKENSEGVE